MMTQVNASLVVVILLLPTFASTYGGQQPHVLSTWPHQVIVHGDLGSRFSLHCNLSSNGLAKLGVTGVVWKKDNELLGQGVYGWKLSRHQTTLIKSNLTRKDSGNFTCQPVGPELHNAPIMSASVVLRTPPEKLANLTVTPSVVYAAIRWAIKSDGGLPITHFTLMYQQIFPFQYGVLHSHNLDSEAVAKSLDKEKHRSTHLPVHISPSARQFFVYHMRPNALYMFKMWATNRLGPGEASVLYVSTETPNTTTPNPHDNSAHHGGNTSSVAAAAAGASVASFKAVKIPSLPGYSDEDLSSTAWLIAVFMVLSTVTILALLSCILIYKESSNDDLSAVDEDFTNQARSAAMQILLDPARSFRRFYRPQRVEERTVLLTDTDYTDEPCRLANNAAVSDCVPNSAYLV